MGKSTAYLIGAVLIMTSFVITQACVKSTTASNDVIGDWARSSDFDGNAWSEAGTFVIGDYAYLPTGSSDRDRFQDLWAYSLPRHYSSQRRDFPGWARHAPL